MRREETTKKKPTIKKIDNERNLPEDFRREKRPTHLNFRGRASNVTGTCLFHCTKHFVNGAERSRERSEEKRDCFPVPSTWSENRERLRQERKRKIETREREFELLTTIRMAMKDRTRDGEFEAVQEREQERSRERERD